jgi:hypothetical protein
MNKVSKTSHCYAEYEEDTKLWTVFCLDLGLAASGKTIGSAKKRMLNDVRKTAVDVPESDDSVRVFHTHPPWQLWVKYYWLAMKYQIQKSIRYVLKS